MPMDEDKLLGRLTQLAPFSDRDEARRVFDATLQALRRGMSDDEADWLAVSLGPTLAAPLLRETYAGPLSPDELYRWTKRYGKAKKSVAAEQAQVVCRVLTELLPEAELTRLQRHLPELAPLFRVPDATSTPTPPRRLRPVPADATLAGGKPGSSRPLSEAGGRERSSAGADAERGHPPAPARDRQDAPGSDDDDAELESATGLQRPEEGRSLATSRHG